MRVLLGNHRPVVAGMSAAGVLPRGWSHSVGTDTVSASAR
jgi:hypothetical protein